MRVYEWASEMKLLVLFVNIFVHVYVGFDTVSYTHLTLPTMAVV